ncbi:uncharacterized protein UBRO_20654 [Ustilago bromivora]|uniref:Uncharacterized protein n=1 Tax=Ustilago bromivora TaxID=307758 RepID=A0A1K0G4B3_9BASI|nr:uncharacterized protein UBRO_20654 [Ustilago bromivora]
MRLIDVGPFLALFLSFTISFTNLSTVSASVPFVSLLSVLFGLSLRHAIGSLGSLEVPAGQHCRGRRKARARNQPKEAAQLVRGEGARERWQRRRRQAVTLSYVRSIEALSR